MRSIQTSYAFPLSSVKPLENLQAYRSFCISESRKAITGSESVIREKCPACDGGVRPFGNVEGLEYVACNECGTLLLQSVAGAKEWSDLLQRVSDYKQSPAAFHSSIAVSRNENVYLPKLEWIQHTLRLQGMSKPRVLELATPPSPFLPVLSQSGTFSDVLSEAESAFADRNSPAVDAAVLLESLDRAGDPAKLLGQVAGRLKKGGLLFVTALVSSGFDISVLGLKNLYVYPPDRTNCFSLNGLVNLLKAAGFAPMEVSTPGVLDVEIVSAHLKHDPSIALSSFESRIVSAETEKREAFQTFLQENLMSSFARVVARLS